MPSPAPPSPPASLLDDLPADVRRAGMTAIDQARVAIEAEHQRLTGALRRRIEELVTAGDLGAGRGGGARAIADLAAAWARCVDVERRVLGITDRTAGPPKVAVIVVPAKATPDEWDRLAAGARATAGIPTPAAGPVPGAWRLVTDHEPAELPPDLPPGAGLPPADDGAPASPDSRQGAA